jgi:hypothetical protein
MANLIRFVGIAQLFDFTPKGMRSDVKAARRSKRSGSAFRQRSSNRSEYEIRQISVIANLVDNTPWGICYNEDAFRIRPSELIIEVHYGRQPRETLGIRTP